MQAARNCLVDGNNNVKVADYSLALYTSPRKPSRTVVSIKWAAPELIVQQPMFTTKSDVWSFGKLLVGCLAYWIYTTTTRELRPCAMKLILRSSHSPDLEWSGKPGPFYHVHDANVF